MSRRHALPNPIGLSVIDLFTCAFIAVFVLNLLADDSQGPSPTKVLGLDFVTAELSETFRSPGYSLNMAWDDEAGPQSSWSPSGDVVWIFEDGKITATNLPNELAAGQPVMVILADTPNIQMPQSVECYITTKNGRSSVVLSAQTSWRARVTAP